MKTVIACNTKFPLGQVVITANAKEALDHRDVMDALARHACGDWGEVCSEDAKEKSCR